MGDEAEKLRPVAEEMQKLRATANSVKEKIAGLSKDLEYFMYPPHPMTERGKDDVPDLISPIGQEIQEVISILLDINHFIDYTKERLR